MKVKTYTELCQYNTIEERYEYLKLGGIVGDITFGFDRYAGQVFYHSPEWKRVREYVIFRDEGCDLGIPGYEIHSQPLVHHMNPIDVDDILQREDWILDPEFLITTTQSTHNAIHYGDISQLPRGPVMRLPGDTKLW